MHKHMTMTTGRASLCALGEYLRRHCFFAPLREQVQIRQKTVRYRPIDKLLDVLGGILCGAKTIARFSNVGEQNAAFARQFLLDEGIRIVGESTGGEHGRKLEYWPSSGRARQYALTGVETQRTVQMEERPIIAPKPAESSIEFF